MCDRENKFAFAALANLVFILFLDYVGEAELPWYALVPYASYVLYVFASDRMKR